MANRGFRYVGIRESGVAHVYRLCAGEKSICSTELDPRLDLYSHSPTGFEWGYAGSGLAQLALAFLADGLDDDTQALASYQEFKRAVVALLLDQGWVLIVNQIQSGPTGSQNALDQPVWG